jgi:hypothetical protein
MQSKLYLRNNNYKPMYPDKKTVYFLFLFMLCNGLSFAQYAVDLVPAELKKNANVVIRNAELLISVKNESNAVVRRHYVYTILNAGGDKYADFVANYDKLRKVSDIEGTLYSADGAKLRSIKKGEVKDYNNTADINLVDDDRVKHHNFGYKIYPYTIEYAVNIEYDGILNLPVWVPVFDEKIAVENSSLRVTTPLDYNLRYKAYNYTGDAVTTSQSKQKEYSWSLKKFAAIEEETYSPSWHELTPSVFLAPANFQMQKYTGSMNNWKEFGLFMYKLNAGRDALPENIKQKVHELTDHLATPEDKARMLYKYMQQNTRYISIQLGIGGWQTLDANFVASKGYGDCKALTNYMYALLKEAGIRSYPTLIKAGRDEDDIIEDFSSNQFNHVILFVPLARDSLWLECTSQTAQPGYMGSFTGNRKALIIDEQDSRLINTPVYNYDDNLQIRSVSAVLTEDGSLNSSISTRYTGLQQDRLDALLQQSSSEGLKEYMHNRFQLSSYEIQEFNHNKVAGKIPSIEEKLNLKVKNFASLTGKRLFVTPNVLTMSSFRIKDAANRKFDFEIKVPFTDIDSVSITLPPGYKVESLPAVANLQFSGAQYKSDLKIEDGKITYTRYFRQLAEKIPAAKTKELADFFDKVYKSDHARIVFVKE